ncbi:hypothetical protein ACFFX1_34120 [Dactylosporangium sucinum]|uniref:Uncharacterized protein n=1 Tax=Dactylosporangium sucinum TaxID=1424081 RepID=A0A917UHB8_9ACTN|nr:hypothetical protein [Dactylosporangium sucinum]GGM86424.1 hypothetical protein GCM10007977_105390 [Dactylosporangium sucinum]
MTRQQADVPRGVQLAVKSAALQARYERRGDRTDIDDAIKFARAAVAALVGHPNRAMALTALGIGLRTRYHLLSDPDDIIEAIGVLQCSLELTHLHAVERLDRTYNLGAAYYQRYQHSRDPRDLEAAESALAKVVAHTPDSQTRAMALSALGLVKMANLRDRAEPQRGEVVDAAFECWRRAATTTAADAQTRIVAATRWAHAAAEHSRSGDCFQAGIAAIEALEALVWRGLTRRGQERHLAVWGTVTRDGAGAAVANGDAAAAVELLERGRAVLWAQQIRPRVAAQRLHASCSDLADRLDAVRDQLDATGGDPAALD